MLPGCPPDRLQELLEPIAERAENGKFDLNDTGSLVQLLRGAIQRLEVFEAGFNYELDVHLIEGKPWGWRIGGAGWSLSINSSVRPPVKLGDVIELIITMKEGTG